MKYLAIAFLSISLVGCSTIKKYWPRDHDPVMFNHLVELDRILESVDCQGPDWSVMEISSAHLARYTAWRQDPQAENIQGLHAHTVRMSKGGSKTFCELGKKTAAQRIQAARSAWEGR
jgi:hypothetical protein